MIDLTQLTISRKLGEGSQGKVFLATDPEGARFAVKLVVLAEHADRQLIFDRATVFRADQLDQMIVPILSHGMVSNIPAALARQLGKMSRDALLLITPFVAGTTLAEVEVEGGLTLRDVVATLAGIAAALTKLPAGVGHGDLRAANIFIRPDGEIALADPDLSINPNPADDVRALAAIALNLAKLAPPDENAQAVKQLRALIEEIAGPGKPLGADEVARRLREIAVLLGASAANVTSVLAKRGHVSAVERPAGPTDPEIPSVGRRRGWQWVGVTIGIVLLPAIALLWSSRLRHEHVTRIQDGGEQTAQADSLYDHTGTVHYAEAIHRLAPNELVAANDGLVRVDFEYSVARIAILSARKEVLWEMRKPATGGTAYLDAKPGHYIVEQDRDLGDAGIQKDLMLVEIDFQHPLGVTTTRTLVNSPRRPEEPSR